MTIAEQVARIEEEIERLKSENEDLRQENADLTREAEEQETRADEAVSEAETAREAAQGLVDFRERILDLLGLTEHEADLEATDSVMPEQFRGRLLDRWGI
jgi:cell division septum initiation protein DivIVA